MYGRFVACLVVLLSYFQSTLAAEEVGDCVGILFYRNDSHESQQMLSVVQQAIQNGWAIRLSSLPQDNDVAQRWKIQSQPTLLLLRSGREVDRLVGFRTLDEVQRRMRLGSSADSLRSASMAAASTPIVRGQSQPASIPLPTGSSLRSTPMQIPQATMPVIKDSRDVALAAHWQETQQPSDPAGATVRIRVDEPTHEAIGTGTIIDTHNGEALVLTCGHLFRDTQGRAPIIVETFFGGAPQIYQGTLIDYRADDTDIGLISFRAQGPIPVARLMDHRELLREGDRVFSWGCDNGANPTQRDSYITKLNRYLGAPNVEVAGKPVQGRSGGGLFNNRGELVGVCYAADEERNEGLYNAPEVVYQQLMKLGLRRLFEKPTPAQPQFADHTLDASTISAPSALAASVSNVPSSAQLNPQASHQPARKLFVTIEENGKREQFEVNNPSPILMDTLHNQRLIR